MIWKRGQKASEDQLFCVLRIFVRTFFFFSILNVVRERKEEYIATLAKVNETPSDENRN